MIPSTETREGIEVQIFAEEEHSTTIVVRAVTECQVATHVSVRLFYWIEAPNFGPIMVSLLDVLPLFGQGRSATTFRVRLADAEFIRIEPMKSFGQLEFFRRPMEPRLLY